MEKDTHAVFVRLVGRVMGALDLAHADESLKRTVKAYIWEAEKDLQQKGVDNERKKE